MPHLEISEELKNIYESVYDSVSVWKNIPSIIAAFFKWNVTRVIASQSAEEFTVGPKIILGPGKSLCDIVELGVVSELRYCHI